VAFGNGVLRNHRDALRTGAVTIAPAAETTVLVGHGRRCHQRRAGEKGKRKRPLLDDLDLFFAGDKGVWRGSWHATQRVDWEGIVATGRKATWSVIIIGRLADYPIFGSEVEAPESESYDKRAPGMVTVIVAPRVF
jgi:hypothetical protein